MVFCGAWGFPVGRKKKREGKVEKMGGRGGQWGREERGKGEKSGVRGEEGK